MSHVIHFEFSLSDEKICIIGLQNLSYFVLYSSVFWFATVFDHVENDERSYFDVVSGSGKFIFAVSTGYFVIVDVYALRDDKMATRRSNE